MKDVDATNLRRRLKNQRRELRKLNQYIAQQALWLQLAHARANTAHRLYNDVNNRRYRTRGYKAWVWWRNRVVWRLGQMLPAVRQHWDARNWYNRGVDDALRSLGVPSGRKFPVATPPPLKEPNVSDELRKRLAVAILCCTVIFWAYLAAQERVQSWTFEACSTNNCIKSTLDKLSPDRARDAKLTTWGSVTYVWYRE